jgi:hypothetical protein
MWPKNYTPADPELDRLLAEQDERYTEILKHANDDLESEIKRHHRDFEDISAVCTLVRNNRMSAETAMTIIQNIVG